MRERESSTHHLFYFMPKNVRVYKYNNKGLW